MVFTRVLCAVAILVFVPDVVQHVRPTFGIL